jgi:hypothetical protein
MASSIWTNDSPNLKAPTGQPAILDLIYHYYLQQAGYTPLFTPRPEEPEPEPLPKD